MFFPSPPRAHHDRIDHTRGQTKHSGAVDRLQTRRNPVTTCMATASNGLFDRWPAPSVPAVTQGLASMLPLACTLRNTRSSCHQFCSTHMASVDCPARVTSKPYHREADPTAGIALECFDPAGKGFPRRHSPCKRTFRWSIRRRHGLSLPHHHLVLINDNDCPTRACPPDSGQVAGSRALCLPASLLLRCPGLDPAPSLCASCF
jgi:hypothetical protein